MTKVDRLKEILRDSDIFDLKTDETIRQILKLFDIEPELILEQDWYEDYTVTTVI